jgi:exportin-T
MKISKVLHEIANLLQTVVKVREHEAQTYFATAFLPSKGWPSNAAIDFSTKLRELDPKSFRKYFTDLIRESRASS